MIKEDLRLWRLCDWGGGVREDLGPGGFVREDLGSGRMWDQGACGLGLDVGLGGIWDPFGMLDQGGCVLWEKKGFGWMWDWGGCGIYWGCGVREGVGFGRIRN